MRCLECGAEMSLVQSVKDTSMFVPGYEHHTWQCSGCSTVEQRMTFTRGKTPTPTVPAEPTPVVSAKPTQTMPGEPPHPKPPTTMLQTNVWLEKSACSRSGQRRLKRPRARPSDGFSSIVSGITCCPSVRVSLQLRGSTHLKEQRAHPELLETRWLMPSPRA